MRTRGRSTSVGITTVRVIRRSYGIVVTTSITNHMEKMYSLVEARVHDERAVRRRVAVRRLQQMSTAKKTST